MAGQSLDLSVFREWYGSVIKKVMRKSVAYISLSRKMKTLKVGKDVGSRNRLGRGHQPDAAANLRSWEEVSQQMDGSFELSSVEIRLS